MVCSKKFRVFVALIVLAAVSAGFGIDTMSTDGRIRHGDTPFSVTGTDGKLLSGTVEYCVYDTDLSVVYNPGSTVGRFIYAYRIANDASSTVSLSQFSLSLLNGSIVDDTSYTSYGVVGVDPLYDVFTNDQSADYFFIMTQINPDEVSNLLILSSDFGPGTTYGSISGGALSTMANNLVAPVPEPASLLFLCLGSTALIVRRKLKD